MTGTSNLWILVGLGVAVTYFWRALGVFLSAHIDPDGPTFKWVTCVSYAMLAGLIARMTIMPFGVLAETPLLDRLIAMAFALAFFFVVQRSILCSVAVGVGSFIFLIAIDGM